jgi:hypothetical protein
MSQTLLFTCLSGLQTYNSLSDRFSRNLLDSGVLGIRTFRRVKWRSQERSEGLGGGFGGPETASGDFFLSVGGLRTLLFILHLYPVLFAVLTEYRTSCNAMSVT